MAKFPVICKCVSCGSENIEIPQKKNADTPIECGDCGNVDRWVKVQTTALIRVRKEASISFQQRAQQFEKEELERQKLKKAEQ